jgi:hypothetical protein
LSLTLVPKPKPHCRYRPREAFLSPLWRILTDHLEPFLSTYDSRFRYTYGPLKPYVEKTFGALQLCGEPNHGVTRFTCDGCGTQMGVPFSCKTRICPSCVKRRAEETAANLVERLPEVPHRHVVITIPRKAGLRLRVLQDPKLFRKIARIVVRVLRRQMVRQTSMNRNRRCELEKVLKPGLLMCQHSFSSDLSFHPHWHLIVSDGIFTPDGDFYHLWNWDTEAILVDLRGSILRAFVRWSKLSSEVAEKLGTWESERSGFSCFVTEQTQPDDKEGMARLIRYLFRSPCSYRQLSYDESTGKVKCRSKRGGFKEWHATEFLAVLAQHVPRPRQHLVTYAGHYANAAGNLKSKEESRPETEQPKPAKSGFKRYSWAELIRRVWKVDPQKCPKCGEIMQRRRTLRGEELQDFLKSINHLGYPARPPPVSWSDPNESQESFGDFAEDDSQQFHSDASQIPPDWESSFAIA